ncbi:methyltransferase domain-containing protein [Oceanicaulis sp.]|uniref:methyltransferase domain-containing protein n=1 Tax=Oceanicaulis sp. TaxID=1924941 RepID=UPI003F6E83F9
MAITAIEYALFKEFRDKQVLPLQGSVLELGESNWYGDVDINRLKGDIQKYAAETQRASLNERLGATLRPSAKQAGWEQAKVFWSTFLQYSNYSAIDFHGTEIALKQDLNKPLKLKDKFDMVLNLGTAEHVFNQAQVFTSIHKHTKPGGLMVHGLPFTGYVDHGFYNFQPTFFWDLAKANAYQVLALIYAELKPLKLVQLQSREAIIAMYKKQALGENSLLYAVMKKPEINASFKPPMQGYYFDDDVSSLVSAGWSAMR